MVLIAGFCHINTATLTQKQMLLSKNSAANAKVQKLIKNYSLRTGTRPELIKGCIRNRFIRGATSYSPK